MDKISNDKQIKGSIQASLIVFDLDETLTESKQALDEEMAGLLTDLLAVKMVAVISGASFPQFEDQFLNFLAKKTSHYENLYLLPTSGAELYAQRAGRWMSIYAEKLSDQERNKIMEIFQQTLTKLNFELPIQNYGQIFEDRGSQITFSALGQEAPLSLKINWDPDQTKRQMIVNELVKFLPEFSVKIGGATSIDITKKGIDKAYGLRRLVDYLNLTLDQVIYVGDALYPGGNDEPLLKTGVDCRSVSSIKDTKELIKQFI